ncbi:NAD-dependent epimerase/dehydratase [Corchorus olitorius]|uniref:NAD-dependent epimerase/dehydratase n=1 Tax=Corchorus olitorius TaxID=93759 RepID=A0A1R3IAH5_9ROSI|nr:NAD-dependent epimerase/dehydratase [Corchorus olitorius]
MLILLQKIFQVMGSAAAEFSGTSSAGIILLADADTQTKRAKAAAIIYCFLGSGLLNGEQEEESSSCTWKLETKDSETKTEAEKVVCVTGASAGYIGSSWLVKFLLQRGSNEKAKGLGVSFIPLVEVSVRDSVESFKEIPLKIGIKLRMSSAAEKVVCMTGASGYIASWLVKLLLQRGYTVKATVRDPKLMDEGCFDSVVEGCQGVFHTASPVFLSAADPQAEIIEPAVKGTLNVLKSCAKAASVKRVVFTSSLAAVLCNGKPLTPDVLVDETWFSDAHFCHQNKLWYIVSKTLAEEAAWSFAKHNAIDLVTINPGLVWGPLLQPTLNFSVFSVEGVLDLTKGENKFPGSTCVFVDVRDVAHAHILAFELPSASGRYCLVERIIHYLEALKILSELYPALGLQEKSEDLINKPLEPTFQISNQKAKDLGVNFIPVEVSLKETVESLMEKGFLSI